MLPSQYRRKKLQERAAAIARLKELEAMPLRNLYYRERSTPIELVRAFETLATPDQQTLFRIVMHPYDYDSWSYVTRAIHRAGFVPTPARQRSELSGGQLVQNLSDSDLAAAYISAWDLSDTSDLGVLSVEFALRKLALPKVAR